MNTSIARLSLPLILTATLVGCAGAKEAAEPPASQDAASQDAASQAQAAKPVAGAIRNVDVEALDAAMKAGTITLIDVRTVDEFASGHIPGARNIPLSDLPDGLTNAADVVTEPDTELWLVCRSGGRSARAAKLLSATGQKVVNVEGGTMAWQAAGKPVE